MQSKQRILSFMVFFFMALIMAHCPLFCVEPGITVYLRNISGYTVEFCITDSATPSNTQWAQLAHGNKTQFFIKTGHFFHYRYTGNNQIRYVQTGPYQYVAAWWKFKPGPVDPGVTSDDGGITLLSGPTVPLLEGDPESADPNVALQPGTGGGGGSGQVQQPQITQPQQPQIQQPQQPQQPVQPPENQVEGQIGTVWRNMGADKGPLGYPTSLEMEATRSWRGTTGRFRNFSQGQIIWHSNGPLAGQAFGVYGAIGGLFIYVGGTSSTLGFPMNNEMNITPSPQGTNGRWQPFEGGLIVWHQNGRLAGRAYSVEGAIASLYQSAGGTGSWLGMPISFEYDWYGGRRSDFEGGYIFWTREAGAKAFYYNAQ